MQRLKNWWQTRRLLEEYQSEPEAVENLEKIPVLRREDISREIAPFFNEEMKLADVPVVYHEIETNGIGYVNVMFDLSGVSAEELAGCWKPCSQ